MYAFYKFGGNDMAITGINNSEYTSYYATSYTKTVKKADCERDSISTKENNVTTSTESRGSTFDALA